MYVCTYRSVAKLEECTYSRYQNNVLMFCLDISRMCICYLHTSEYCTWCGLLCMDIRGIYVLFFRLKKNVLSDLLAREALGLLATNIRSVSSTNFTTRTRISLAYQFTMFANVNIFYQFLPTVAHP
jgi:hypothetical protein